MKILSCTITYTLNIKNVLDNLLLSSSQNIAIYYKMRYILDQRSGQAEIFGLRYVLSISKLLYFRTVGVLYMALILFLFLVALFGCIPLYIYLLHFFFFSKDISKISKKCRTSSDRRRRIAMLLGLSRPLQHGPIAAQIGPSILSLARIPLLFFSGF